MPMKKSILLILCVVSSFCFANCFLPVSPGCITARRCIAGGGEGGRGRLEIARSFSSSFRSRKAPQLLAAKSKEVLAEQQRLKDNPAPDAFFYDYPRFCYHADAEFHAELTNLYKEELPFGPETRVLDLMSSWVSHYPTDRSWGRVDAIGMNVEELQRNPQVDFGEVWDLNANASLPFPDACFDAVTCALSVQYLMYPEKVFADIARVLKPGGKAVFSFSNRMFPSKAVYGWRSRGEGQRVTLVQDYFRTTLQFEEPRAVDKSTLLHRISYLSAYYLGQPLTGDPFYAVIAQKKAQ